MKKNWLATKWSRGFRARPPVPDAAFQDETEPYPGHWRALPEPWPDTDAGPAVLDAALAELPELWRQVVLSRGDDLGLTPEQERDILALARAAVRDHLDRARP